MANISYLHSDRNTSIKKEIEVLEKQNGVDGLKSREDNYNLDLYGEFVPTLFSWITPDEQMKRSEEIVKGVD